MQESRQRGGVRSVQVSLVALLIFSAGCGRGGGTGGVQPPTPQPDFTLGLSTPSVDVPQGGTSSPVNVSISSLNGFSASVQISFTGLPSGITTNPASPFPVSAGQSVSVLFGASPNASAGQSSVTAQASSGSLSHSQTLTLAIQSVTQANLPRTGYVENDSVASVDTPVGEPRRRQIVYDLANQRFYVANGAMNRVEVYSAASPSLQTTIDAPGASSVDLSTDGTTLWIGTSTEQILAVDTSSLQVKTRYPVAGITPIPNVVFIRPTEVLALSSGKALVRLHQAAASESLLSLWDPSSNSFTDLTSLAPALFQNGAGVLARSGDHSRVLAASNDSTGELAVFDSNGNLLVGPLAPTAGTISVLAANSGGSQFAVAIAAGGTSQVLLLDSKLNLDGPAPAAPPATGNHGGIDIRDAHNGQLRLRLYRSEPFAMLNSDVDGLHGGFLTTDENGQRLSPYDQLADDRAIGERPARYWHALSGHRRVGRGSQRHRARQRLPERDQGHAGRKFRDRYAERREYTDAHDAFHIRWPAATGADKSGR